MNKEVQMPTTMALEGSIRGVKVDGRRLVSTHRSDDFCADFALVNAASKGSSPCCPVPLDEAVRQSAHPEQLGRDRVRYSSSSIRSLDMRGALLLLAPVFHHLRLP